MAGFIGQVVRRKEDPRLITGRGTYTENLKLPGMLHAVFVRSPFAHARITRVDAAAALALPGVVRVLAGADVPELVIRDAWGVPGADVKVPPHPALAADTVRFMGEPVAVVVAESRYQAEDAAELVEVDYEPLPAVAGTKEALAPDAPQIHESVPGNRGAFWRIDEGDADAAFRDAEVVVRLSLMNNRIIPTAIEARAILASYTEFPGELTVWMTTQMPHGHRSTLARFFDLPEQKVRVIAPDVGGGFGAKGGFYPEDVLVPFLAKSLGRPVKWAQTRREDFVATIHARDHESEAELAAKRDGTLLGIRGRSYTNFGAYLSMAAAMIPTVSFTHMLGGAYRMPAVQWEVTAAYTNTMSIDAVRGAGGSMAALIIERLIDQLAREIGVDPVEIRRRNFIQPEQFPYLSATGLAYDSGDYERALDVALKAFDYDAFRQEQARLRAEGRYIGVGLASFVHCTGFAPSRLARSPSAAHLRRTGGGIGFESAEIKVMPSGKVLVAIGTSPHGQSGHTTTAQIVADIVGVPFDDIEVQSGDTATGPWGMGTFADRGAVTTGNAVRQASVKVQSKAKRIAAHLLEAAEEDIEVSVGRYGVRGSPDKGRSFAQVAAAAYGNRLPEEIEHGLHEIAMFDPTNFAFPFGTHLCAVEVDPETGDIALTRYVGVDDCGVQINPQVVEGQIHGAVVQGLGQAFWEDAQYDADGQLLTASLLDYGLPRADMVPEIETGHTETPAPENPLGVKGVGEAGTIAAIPAAVNAVLDALAPLGVTDIALPMTRERVWRAIQAAR